MWDVALGIEDEEFNPSNSIKGFAVNLANQITSRIQFQLPTSRSNQQSRNPRVHKVQAYCH